MGIHFRDRAQSTDVTSARTASHWGMDMKFLNQVAEKEKKSELTASQMLSQSGNFSLLYCTRVSCQVLQMTAPPENVIVDWDNDHQTSER